MLVALIIAQGVAWVALIVWANLYPPTLRRAALMLCPGVALSAVALTAALMAP